MNMLRAAHEWGVPRISIASAIGVFVSAIRNVLPDAPIVLPAGHDPAGLGEDVYLDTSRLRADTGFEPAYDVERGVADYVA